MSSTLPTLMGSIAPSSLIVVSLFSRISASARSMFGSWRMFAADDHAVHSPCAFCTLWSNYTTQTHGSVRDTLPHTVVGVWWISADGTFSPTRNLITVRCSTLRGTFCSLITLATPRQDWTGSNPRRWEGGGCGFTLSRSHSCCAVRLVDTQISPGHIWTILY